MTYEQALKDWQYLWSIGAAYDMTGGYVDQCDLEKLLLNPTKKTAKDCLCNQISYWFNVGPDLSPGRDKPASHFIESDTKVREIAERHFII